MIDEFANIIILCAVIMAIVMGITLISASQYTIECINGIHSANISLETHKIIHIEKYNGQQNDLIDCAFWKPEKYPCKIKYEITTDTGEIIGTTLNNLKLNGTCTMYINKCKWNDAEIAWFNDCYEI